MPQRDEHYEYRREADTKIAVILNDMGYIKEKLSEIDSKVGQHYVSKDEFEPIKKIVYGLVGLILVAVVGALVGLVLK